MNLRIAPQVLQDGVGHETLPNWPYEFTDPLVSRQDGSIIAQPLTKGNDEMSASEISNGRGLARPFS